MKYIIYSHTNYENGKSYIGWTVVRKGQTLNQSIALRWQRHCRDARSGSSFLFHNAIRKYGEGAWEHEVIDVVSRIENAKHAEVLWIKQRNTYAFAKNGFGYNMTRGGDGWPDGTRTKELMNDSKLRAHLSDMKRGENNPTYGKKFSAKDYPNKGMRGKSQKSSSIAKIRLNQPRQCALICTIPDGEITFTSLGEAVRWLRSNGSSKAAKSNLYKACKGLIKQTYGYVWRYT
jgi:hypothetical protein